jgi:NADH-quinone oxidoreductase subunit G
MAKVIVDGVEIDVPAGYSVLQACEAAGAEIPRFCYHERLSIAGNCRMCLVEWQGAPKPIASCAYGVKDLRPDRDGSPPKINTRTPMVKKAREGVMEFLLINHPLDCPICDQGGECDLQDQAMAYGRSGTRYELNKRAVEDKYMGPLVKTIMTRCIQCTRCVRFAAEVAGVEELGATGRGEDMEITTYLERAMTSELSGNVIDLCPVGALTSKPYAFNARPWELKKTETIDVMDAVGSAIRMDARGAQVMRIMPRVNEDVNEEWISDKTRFVWDGLNRQRLDRPYVRKDGRLQPVTWGEALGAAAEALRAPADRIAALAGDLACVESLRTTLDLMRALGVQSTDCRLPGCVMGVGANGVKLPRAAYTMGAGLGTVAQADVLLLVGVNPRHEAAVWNARIRQAWLRGLEVGVIGPQVDLTYGYSWLGDSPAALSGLLTGEGPFGQKLQAARRPMVVLGEGALAHRSGRDVLAACLRLAAGSGALAPAADGQQAWNGFGVLQSAASRVGGLDVGFVPGAGGRDAAAIVEAAQTGGLDTLLLLGADEVALPPPGACKVIYLGTHGDAAAARADIILPGAAYSEKSAIYVNTAGLVQQTTRAVFPKGEAREDWAVLRALSERVGKTLPFNSLADVRAALVRDVPTFASSAASPGASEIAAQVAALMPLATGEIGALSADPFRPVVEAFHLTNPIARASKVMAECHALAAAPTDATLIAAE